VGLHKPTSIAFDCTNEFRFYKSGVFSSDSCGTKPKDVNHAVLAVGYGTENGADYWLVKNSWGTEWGDGGFFKIQRDTNECGVATCASYPELSF
jgi:cathepsin H